MNPVVYFEIPVIDIQRAINFYSNVFGFQFDLQEIDDNQMALFPFYDNEKGITGALAFGEIYKTTKEGVLIYFHTSNIEITHINVTKSGGKILYPITKVEAIGYVSEFEDSEGNRIALFQKEK